MMTLKELALQHKAESYQLESIRIDVGGLERYLREACSCIDELRNAFEATLERVEQLERKIEAIEAV